MPTYSSMIRSGLFLLQKKEVPTRQPIIYPKTYLMYEIQPPHTDIIITCVHIHKYVYNARR